MKLSMMQKFMALLLPLAIMGVICVTLTWKSLSGDGKTLARANRANELAQSSRIYVSEMGSALKGYLLNPSNKAEAEAKKAADDNNGKALEELVKIITDEKILKLAREMDEFDDKKLNNSENDVMGLVEKGQVAEAQKKFTEEYLPLRAQYDRMSKELASEVSKVSQEEIENVKTSQTHAAWIISLALLAGLLVIGFALVVTTWRLRGSLRDVVASVDHSAEKLSRQSQAINGTSSKMSEVSARQSSALQQTAASVEEINAMVKRTSENAQQSEAVAKLCTEKADEGKSVIAEMLGSIERINESSGMIRTTVENGNRQIGEIVNVMSEVENKTRVINDIVFQTKLLSFNASVEAARAGEHGKGFAVVAEEIGNLAQMSGNAAKEISEMLLASSEKVTRIIDSNRADVEKQIARGQECADDGGKVARTCADVFEDLITHVNGMTHALKEISVASTEQAAGVNEITKAIAELDHVARETAVATSEVVSASGEVSEQSHELLAVVQSLTVVINGSSSGDGAAHVVDMHARGSGPKQISRAA